ncbi:PTS sugar transporter subunit IIA [Blautia sp. HCP28S3_G10]|uniref:PTS sugar transporter subunit IIA n=1 Tax=Blautia sp. HCP28S3_G10 TaxID=3438908 RepID=UPI003F8B5C20
MIWEDMKESLIFRALQVSDNKEALEIMGNVMLQEGYVLEDFPVAVWEREKDFPTGLDVDGIGVAIPHTEAHHVKKEGVALAILKEPVEFGAMGEESCRIPVKIIIMFTVAGKEKHLDRLMQIVRLLQDRKFLTGILAAEDKKQIIEIVRQREKNISDE